MLSVTEMYLFHYDKFGTIKNIIMINSVRL